MTLLLLLLLSFVVTAAPLVVMSIPWKFHGNFIWAKTHGKLMDFSFEIFMGHFCKGHHEDFNEERPIQSTSTMKRNDYSFWQYLADIRGGS